MPPQQFHLIAISVEAKLDTLDHIESALKDEVPGKTIITSTAPVYLRLTMNTVQVNQKTVKTRLCILSDTHAHTPGSENSPCAFRRPLPTADVILHAGDLTMTGRLEEYQGIFDFLSEADAELKIVIAGNHDITLDEEFYKEIGQRLFHPNMPEDLSQVREMWTGSQARQAGIIYMDEGMRTFQLKNGARFTVFFFNCGCALLRSLLSHSDAH